jgi:hypothetical protein
METTMTVRITAATLANNATIERALNDVLTQDELDTAIAEIASLSFPAETVSDNINLPGLSSDAIAVLGDGSVLASGAETVIYGRSYRALVVYLTDEESVGVMSAQLQSEIWEDSQAAEV